MILKAVLLGGLLILVDGHGGRGGGGSALKRKPRTGIASDSQCGVSKGCYSNCKGDQCGFLVTWRNQTGSTIITIQTAIGSRTSFYASLGLSDDRDMGDDSCMDCIFFGGSASIVQSWNDGDENERLANTGLTAINATAIGGILTCEFTRQNSVPGNGQIYDVTKDWILFLATGGMEELDELEEHDFIPWISDGRSNLQSWTHIKAQDSAEPIVKAHGAFMVIAWMLFANFGMILARYYRDVWPEQKIRGKAVWFQLHWPAMGAATVFTFLGFLLILIYNEGEMKAYAPEGLASAHGVLGVILFVLALLNPIGAFFRPGPDDKFRWVFSWGHRIIAIISQIFSSLVMCGGALFEQSFVKATAFFLIIGYIVWMLVVEITLLILSYCVKRRDSVDVDMNGIREKSPNGNEEKIRNIKKIILVIHVAASLCFAFAVIGFISEGLS